MSINFISKHSVTMANAVLTFSRWSDALWYFYDNKFIRVFIRTLGK